MGIEDSSPMDHYESLMQTLWSIPAENIIKTSESIGSGNFGKVMKGFVQRGESKIECVLHSVHGNNILDLPIGPDLSTT